MSCLRRFFLLSYQNNMLPTARRGFSIKGDEMQERKIQVGDHQINYLKIGKGPHNLLLMPGALGSIWTNFTPQIKGLNRDLFTIVAWDPPGYGKSIPPKREFPLNYFEKDANSAVLLMKALDLPLFSPIGWSDGGITAMILAATYPTHVKKMVIWGANSHILPSELKIWEDIRDLSKWSDKMKEPLIAEYGEEYLKETWEGWCDGFNNIYKENRGDICMALLTKIKCPTFILHGAKDPLIHPQHVPTLTSNIEQSQLHVFPEGKHNIHQRYADEFNEMVTEFLVSNNRKLKNKL